MSAALAGLRGIPRPALTIIGGLLLMAIGNYMVIPFLALYLTQVVGLSVSEVGIILAVRLWAQRGLSLFGGLLVDRLGGRSTMALGLLLRALAYGGVAQSDSFATALIWTALIGVSGALYMPAGKATLARLVSPDIRVLVFSLRNLAINLGVALGPAIGLAAAASSYAMSFRLAAGVFLLLLVLTLVLVPNDAPTGTAAPRIIPGIADLSVEPRVMWLAGVMAVFFVLYVQIELTMPLFADLHYSARAAGLLFTVNAVTVVALQIPLAGWIERSRLATVLATGLLACGVGLALMAVSSGLLWFLAAVAIFTVGEITIEPKVDGEVSRIVEPSRLGTSFGLLSLAGSLGGALGYYAGGIGFQLGRELGDDRMIWAALAALALAAAWVLSVTLQRPFAGSVMPAQHEGEAR